jgi:hypothetical protein
MKKQRQTISDLLPIRIWEEGWIGFFWVGKEKRLRKSRSWVFCHPPRRRQRFRAWNAPHKISYSPSLPFAFFRSYRTYVVAIKDLGGTSYFTIARQRGHNREKLTHKSPGPILSLGNVLSHAFMSSQKSNVYRWSLALPSYTLLD